MAGFKSVFQVVVQLGRMGGVDGAGLLNSRAECRPERLGVVLVVPSLRVYILQLGEFVNLVHPHRTLVIDTDIAGLPLFSGDDHYTVGAAQAIERRSRATAKDVHRLDVVRIDVYRT